MSAPTRLFIRRCPLQACALSLAIVSAAWSSETICAQEPAATTRPAETRGTPPTKVDQARAHFDRAVEYYEDSDFSAALLEFRRAYALQHAYQLLYNLGQVSAELRDYAGAERYFRRYLVEGEGSLTPERRSEVVEELGRLAGRVGALRLSTNQHDAQIRIDKQLVERPEAGPVRVSAGQRQVVAQKAGYAPVRRTVDVLGGEMLDVALQFGPPLAQAQAAASEERASSSNTLPWVTGITSAVVLAAAGGIGYWAYQDSLAYDTQLNRFTSQAELDRITSQERSKALIADILLGTAVAGGIVTIVLILSGSSSEAPPAVAAQPRFKLAATGMQLVF